MFRHRFPSPFRLVRALRRSERGNASVEYALIGAIIALGTIGALKNLKYGLTGNFDRISLQIQRVNNDTSGTRKETSRVDAGTYYSNGIRIDQSWIYYDDGSTVLYRTSPDANSWFKSITYDFGKDGVNHGADVLRGDGSTYSEKYEIIRDAVVNVTYTEGKNTHSYLQEQVNLGNGYYGYRQSMNNSNIANDWTSGYVVNYYGSDANGKYVENNIGSTYTYQNGQTVNYGGDISKYR